MLITTPATKRRNLSMPASPRRGRGRRPELQPRRAPAAAEGPGEPAAGRDDPYQTEVLDQCQAEQVARGRLIAQVFEREADQGVADDVDLEEVVPVREPAPQPQQYTEQDQVERRFVELNRMAHRAGLVDGPRDVGRRAVGVDGEEVAEATDRLHEWDGQDEQVAAAAHTGRALHEAH